MIRGRLIYLDCSVWRDARWVEDSPSTAGRGLAGIIIPLIFRQIPETCGKWPQAESQSQRTFVMADLRRITVIVTVIAARIGCERTR